MSVSPECMFMQQVHAWDLQGQGRSLDRLELELGMVVSHHAGAGN